MQSTSTQSALLPDQMERTNTEGGNYGIEHTEKVENENTKIEGNEVVSKHAAPISQTQEFVIGRILGL